MESSVVAVPAERAPSISSRPPGPTDPWWVQLGAVRRDFLGFLTTAGERYGDIFCIRPAPATRIFVLNSVELATEVLTGRAYEFGKSAQTRLMVGKFLGNGLVLSEGDEHAAQRRLLQPSFGARELATIGGPIVDETRRLVATWEPAAPVDVEPALTRLSMRIILKFLVGSLTGSDVDDSDVTAFRHFAEAIGGRFRSMPWPAWVPTPQNFRERAAIKQVDRLVADLLARSRARGHEPRGLLGILGRRLDDGRLTLAEVRDHLVTTLFAGHETVAKVLSWTLYLLARHPGIQDAVRDEANSVSSGRPLDTHDVPRLAYTTSVIRESMRLYPPVWVFDRSPLRPLDLGGQSLRPKDIVYVSPFLLHRQSRYFPGPLQFDPGRFEPGKAAATSSAYIPFGAGRRGCIGQAMAMVEAVLVVATLIQRVEIRPADDDEVLPKPDATLAPATPIRLRVIPT